MLGIFDSGLGGENVLCLMRELGAECDVIFLKDVKNAPYGTKTEDEILDICKRNLSRLLGLGAKKVLIACCTAGTVHPRLPLELKERSVPIILPTARAALKRCPKDRIAVLATNATVRSRAFFAAVGGAEEICAQGLVAAVESGEKDGSVGRACREYIHSLLRPLDGRTDCLILGCTHFHSLGDTIAKIGEQYGIKSIVSSAAEGANEAIKLARVCTSTSKRDIIIN